MSKIEVNTIDSQCGSALQIGDGNTATIGLGKSGDTITVPCGATIVNSGTATGFGRTGTVDWVTTPKVTGDSPITAVTGEGYFLNTTAGTITVNLPAGAAGSIVSMMDYAGTWNDNNVTVSPNGSEKIGGVADNALLNTEGQSVTFVYVDSTQGWLNTMDSTSNVRANAYITATVSGACNTLATAPDCANTKIATFLGPGTFCVASVAPCAADNVVSYMVVAGGGGSGKNRGGGGGAGGFREFESPVTPYTASPLEGATPITASVQGYPIVIGGGGAGSPCCSGMGTKGTPTTGLSITSTGGGGGGSVSTGSLQPAPAVPNASGGSGGGHGSSGGSGASPPFDNGGTGNFPPVSPAQGTDGGDQGRGSPYAGATGGGGATFQGSPQNVAVPSVPSSVGQNQGVDITPSNGGEGGDGGQGATSSISASPVGYAGGGGGGGGFYAPSFPGSPAKGGTGGMFGNPGTGTGPLSGGGNGATGCGATGSNGSANTGGGAGGGSGSGGAAAQGGSGIVIIRYKFQ